MSNRKNVQNKTTAFGEPNSEPTKTRAGANVIAKSVKRKASPTKKMAKIEVKKAETKPTKSKNKKAVGFAPVKPVVGIANPVRGEIPKILYESYQSPPFNRFYLLAIAISVLISAGAYFGWQYTSEVVSEKIEVVSESPKVHSWISKVTNKRSHKMMREKNSGLKRAKKKASRKRRR